ncbi:MAG: hypothetical protein HYX74_05855 [Acidobacteria bacterium]|nr:hypothetical protein [Acidobacteriota bacterium]
MAAMATGWLRWLLNTLTRFGARTFLLNLVEVEAWIIDPAVMHAHENAHKGVRDQNQILQGNVAFIKLTIGKVCVVEVIDQTE